MTIAVLGILVLLAAPRLLGYTEKAELTRIRHDVKVMEQEMDIALIENKEDFVGWDDNGKDLGKLILSDKLYEKEGFAKNIEKSHLARYYESMRSNPSELGVGGEAYALTARASEEGQVDLKVSLGYKIVPQKYSSKIKTKLKGTFYANPEGKVYYEHDKALKSQKDDSIEACNAPIAESLGYTFEIINGKGTITKYDHREQNIVIPSAFKIEVDGEEVCEPVRVIGKAAFAYGPLKEIKIETIVIPDSVEIIEDEAFKDNNIKEIIIPSSVTSVGENVFTGNGIETIIVRGNSSSSPINSSNSQGANIDYNYGTPGDLDIIFDYSSGTVIDYNGNGQGGSAIIVPEHVTSNGVNYPVKVVAKGAYQGQGLISAILPESLERIEDYAFSGNQLTGITIPNSVIHIGNYAFSFNEKTHSISGDKIATMKTVIMQNAEQFNKIDKFGDILESGVKVNLLKGKVSLLDQIFVTSIGNNVQIVADEENTPGEPVVPVVFEGLGPEAWDGDKKTSVSWHKNYKNVTWSGDLDNKELTFEAYTFSNTTDYSFNIKFYDNQNKILRSPSTPEKDATALVSRSVIKTFKVIVPSGASRMEIYSDTDSNKLFEISTPERIVDVKSQQVHAIPGDSKISLEWGTKQRALIIRNNVKMSDSTKDSFVDKPLQPNEAYNYEILFFDEYGNGSEVVKVLSKTKNREVVFKGLTPEAWDGDKETYVRWYRTHKKVTWTGDLDNKELSFMVYTYANTSNSRFDIKFYNSKNEVLRSPSTPERDFTSLVSARSISTLKVIVPAGAESMDIYSDDDNNKLFEISTPEKMSDVKSQQVHVNAGYSKISLDWGTKQRVLITRNNVKMSDSMTDFFVDKPLQPNEAYNYELLFFDEYGNGSEVVKVTSKIENREIVFKGLNPGAWDGDEKTYVEDINKKTIEWTGNLDNKEIAINFDAMGDNYAYSNFYDESGRILASPSSSDGRGTNYFTGRGILKLIVPEGAKSLNLRSDRSSTKIYEISAEGNKVID